MFWGKLASINLYECNPKTVRSETELKTYLRKICKEIGMKKYGKPVIKKFGNGTLNGFSVMQLIETSSITIHCDETENRVFIDIFSTKDFDDSGAEILSRKFFEAEKSKTNVQLRE